MNTIPEMGPVSANASAAAQFSAWQNALDSANERFAAAAQRELAAGTYGKSEALAHAILDREAAGAERYRLKMAASEFMLTLFRITAEERNAQLNLLVQELPSIQELATVLVKRGIV